MEPILEIGNRHSSAVIEDNAHGLLGRYKGRNLGTFGCLAVQRFHETKNVICGEGGALVINDPKFAERAEILRDKGTNRSRFFRGEVDKYTWVDLGSSYLPSDILAAFLCVSSRGTKKSWPDASGSGITTARSYASGLAGTASSFPECPLIANSLCTCSIL
jgi:dTDP-4-amino-4,6-dideoxygalactose transaminase